MEKEPMYQDYKLAYLIELSKLVGVNTKGKTKEQIQEALSGVDPQWLMEIETSDEWLNYWKGKGEVLIFN